MEEPGKQTKFLGQNPVHPNFGLASLKHCVDEIKEDLRIAITLQRPHTLLHDKQLRIFNDCGTKYGMFILYSRKEGNTFDFPDYKEVLWSQKIVNESEKTSGDIWTLEKFPNQYEETYFLKNVTFNGYLRTVNEYFNNYFQKVTLCENKLNNQEFEWKIVYHGCQQFNIFNHDKKALSSFPSNNIGKDYLCLSRSTSVWQIQIAD